MPTLLLQISSTWLQLGKGFFGVTWAGLWDTDLRCAAAWNATNLEVKQAVISALRMVQYARPPNPKSLCDAATSYAPRVVRKSGRMRHSPFSRAIPPSTHTG
ncbi:hypothetical protein F5Y10DRAFT_254007 [Nemania abortiva]|nr:hypothetical protein F5Y10DRAFT_254007 [Nemania abortiva]